MEIETIKINGSFGEGGGQIIRTALSLAVMTRKPVHLYNVRAKRKEQGLKAQHLAGFKAIAQICRAKISGAEMGSKEIFFRPEKIQPGKYSFDIGTAGSISLLLQTLMPALSTISKPVEIEIKGGTDVKMAPPIDYIDNVLLRLLSRLCYKASLSIIRRGFYPKGGGIVKFYAEPMELEQFNFTKRGNFKIIEGSSVASMNLKIARVSERQAQEARAMINKERLNTETKIKSEYAETYSPGSVITLWLETEKSIIGSSALGERGKSSEQVGREAALALINEIKSNAVVDIHAADQLLPFLALTKSSLKTSAISGHARTNIYVIEKFLPVKFKIDEKENIIACKKA